MTEEETVFYLSTGETERWRELSSVVLRGERLDPAVLEDQPPPLRPALCYYLAVNLIAEGRVAEAREWLALGAGIETIRANAYLLDYLERNGGELKAVQPSFSDPRPWAHFSSLPHLSSAREVLADFFERSLPVFTEPLRVMDIGCGNGRLCVSLLKRLVGSGHAAGVGEVLVLDPSTEMLAEARSNVLEAFPGAEVIPVEGKLEQVSRELPRGYDLALCALSVHHMPYEQKEVHIGALAEAVRHIIVFELGANHDTPEMCAPELVYSVYQTFGQSLEYIFAQEAETEVQNACADIFVMSETVSLLSEPRGKRTEYHMPRAQWHRLLAGVCPPGMRCLGERTCFCDEYCELVALHYGR